MELLLSFRVNCELSRDEFVRTLRCENLVEQVQRLRQVLFEDAVRRILADDGDVIVQRKKMNAGKLVVEEHAEDVWSLTCAIRRYEGVPRILLRNGKRRKEELIKTEFKQREKKADGSCEFEASSSLAAGGVTCS